MDFLYAMYLEDPKKIPIMSGAPLAAAHISSRKEIKVRFLDLRQCNAVSKLIKSS